MMYAGSKNSLVQAGEFTKVYTSMVVASIRTNLAGLECSILTNVGDLPYLSLSVCVCLGV